MFYFPDDIQEMKKNMFKILNLQEKILLGQEVLKLEIDTLMKNISIKEVNQNKVPICPFDHPIKDINMYKKANKILEEINYKENFVSF